jgi:PPOX class probable F420-dependent enzyme
MAFVPDSHRDLLDAQFATLATVGADGRPQASEVWFLAEDDTVGISLNTARQKTKNLEQHPGCSLLILDLANPYRYLEIRGDAELSPDLD